MNTVTITLVLLSAMTLNLLAAGSPPDVATQCPLAVNEVLKDLKLKSYKIEKDTKSTQGIRETGELSDGTKVMVESSGCETLRRVYTLSYKDTKTPANNAKYWLTLAGKSLKALQKDDLGTFVTKLKKIPSKGPQPVDSMLTLHKSTIERNTTETRLIFETELAILVE